MNKSYTIYHNLRPQWVKASGAKDGIFWKNQVNTKAADALATYVARSSAAMVLTVYNTEIPVFHQEGIQWPLPFQHAERYKRKYIFKFLDNNSAYIELISHKSQHVASV